MSVCRSECLTLQTVQNTQGKKTLFPFLLTITGLKQNGNARCLLFPSLHCCWRPSIIKLTSSRPAEESYITSYRHGIHIPITLAVIHWWEASPSPCPHSRRRSCTGCSTRGGDDGGHLAILPTVLTDRIRIVVEINRHQTTPDSWNLLLKLSF